MNKTAPRLLGIGGAHVDRRGQVAGPFIPGASNPGTMREDIGGGVFNALRTAVRRGAACSLFSVRGGDGGGLAVADAVEAAGIHDLSGVFLDRATASYTALLDGTGDVVAALADMDIYEAAFPRRMRLSSLRQAIARSDAMLLDANPPEAALLRLVGLAGRCPIHAIAISPAKVVRFRSLLPSLACLYLNAREAAALTGGPDAAPAEQVGRLRALGLGSAVISAGGGPILFYDAHGAGQLHPPPLAAVTDATGAGDALAGGTLAARLDGMPIAQAVRFGAAAAHLALRSLRSVPIFDAHTFAEALALVPEAEPLKAKGNPS